MAKHVCTNGHTFAKSSSCPVCPICSSEAMQKKYGSAFSKIGAPAFRALDVIGITYLKQLTKYTEQDLLNLHGVGPKAVGILKETLKQKGFSLKKY